MTLSELEGLLIGAGHAEAGWRFPVCEPSDQDLYIAAAPEGVIKFGRSRSPRLRVAQHENRGRAHIRHRFKQDEVVRFTTMRLVVAVKGAGCRQNESALCRLFRAECFSYPPSQEWFRGGRVNKLVDLLDELLRAA